MSNKLEEAVAACKNGDVQALHEALSAENAPHVNEHDAEGNSMIKTAVSHGQVVIVQELLARGADYSEMMASEQAQQNPQIAAVLFAHDQAVKESHVGQETSDGTDNYMQAANFSQQQGGPMYPGMQPHFMPDGSGPFFFPPAGSASGQPYGVPNGAPFPFQQMLSQQSDPEHLRNHSMSAAMNNLPPPEVAKNIPCKFFPNCRYGDQCVFNHPQGISNVIPSSGATQPAGSGGAQPVQSSNSGPGAGIPPPMSPSQQNSATSPTSPSMSAQSPVPGAPMFFHPPPGYGYAPPFGVPSQPFYIGPPPHMQYPHGMHAPMQFIPPHLQQAHEQQQSHAGQRQSQQQGSSEEKLVDQAEKSGAEMTLGASADAFVPGQVKDDVAPTASIEATAAAQKSGEDGASGHLRRQSFGSFLHHHAIPFEPTQASTLAMMNMVQQPYMGTNGGGFFPRGSGKASRRGGAGGKRGGLVGNGERQTCVFFLRSKCRYGDDCNNPHTLSDGTDARRNKHTDDGSKFASKTLSKVKPGAATVGPNSSSAERVTAPDADAAKESAESLAQTEVAAAAVDETEKKESAAPVTNGVPGSSVPAAAPKAPASSSRPFGAHAQHMPFARGGAAGARGGRAAAVAKKATPQQRIPNGDDFPALPLSPNASAPQTPPIPSTAALSSPTGAPDASTTSTPPASTINAASAPRVNFSAILSAPPPAKPVKTPEAENESAPLEGQAAVTEEASDEKASDAKQVTAASVLAAGASAKPTAPSQVNGYAESKTLEKPKIQINGQAKKPQAVNGNGRQGQPRINGAAQKQQPQQVKQPQQAAVPASEDDFTPVKGKHAAKRSSVLPTKGINVANVVPTSAEETAGSNDFNSTAPRAVAA